MSLNKVYIYIHTYQKDCAIATSDNITDMSNIMIWLDYVVVLRQFYLNKNFKVNILIQYEVIAHKVFGTLVAVSLPS